MTTNQNKMKESRNKHKLTNMKEAKKQVAEFDKVQPKTPDMEIKKEKTPNAGSDEAVDLGCTCPVMDNEYGRGYMGMEGVFVHTAGCPLHGESLKQPTNDKDDC